VRQKLKFRFLPDGELVFWKYDKNQQMRSFVYFYISNSVLANSDLFRSQLGRICLKSEWENEKLV